MAKYKTFFPGGVYPEDYVPSIPGFDYNPMFGELVDLSTATQTSATSTTITYDLVNGLVLKISGTGFDFDGEEAVAGKVTKFELFQNDGTTLVSRLSSLSVSLAAFLDAAATYDPWNFQGFLLNGNDILIGSAGNDDLFGGAGNDVLRGKGGDDYMVGSEGKDKYDGGGGFDFISFSDGRDNPHAFGGIVLNAADYWVWDPYGNKEFFTDIEGFRGTNFGDLMRGSANDEQFHGLGGRDTINGRGGFDIVSYHSDENNGGLGIGVFVDLGAGTATDGFGQTDKLISIEGARGTDYDDELIGSNAGNFLRGDDGDDTLSGGRGNDNLVGGDGEDEFIFNTALNADTNVDNIEDFDETDDSILLALAIFTQLDGTGALLASEFAANASGDATTADQRILYSTATGELFYDADGNGAGDKVLFATLEAGLSLSESNFEVI